MEGRDPRAFAALQAQIASHPLVVVNERPDDAPVVLGLDVELWDANAIGLSARAFSALGLLPDGSVVVHVPIGPDAIAETRTLGFDGSSPRPEVATG